MTAPPAGFEALRPAPLEALIGLGPLLSTDVTFARFSCLVTPAASAACFLSLDYYVSQRHSLDLPIYTFVRKSPSFMRLELVVRRLSLDGGIALCLCKVEYHRLVKKLEPLNFLNRVAGSFD